MGVYNMILHIFTKKHKIWLLCNLWGAPGVASVPKPRQERTTVSHEFVLRWNVCFHIDNSRPIMTHPSWFVLHLYCHQYHLYHCIRVLVFKKHVNAGGKQVYGNVAKQVYAKGCKRVSNGIKVFSFDSRWVCRFRRYRMKSNRGGKHNAAKQLSVQYPWRGWSLCEGTAHIRCTNSNEGGRTHRDMEVLHTFGWGHLLKNSIIFLKHSLSQFRS